MMSVPVAAVRYKYSYNTGSYVVDALLLAQEKHGQKILTARTAPEEQRAGA